MASGSGFQKIYLDHDSAASHFVRHWQYFGVLDFIAHGSDCGLTQHV
jgi:hypothetical protein